MQLFWSDQFTNECHFICIFIDCKIIVTAADLYIRLGTCGTILVNSTHITHKCTHAHTQTHRHKLLHNSIAISTKASEWVLNFIVQDSSPTIKECVCLCVCVCERERERDAPIHNGRLSYRLPVYLHPHMPSSHPQTSSLITECNRWVKTHQQQQQL